MAADNKSLAHPDWPYAGTAHEWRGFVKGEPGTIALSAEDFATFVKVLENPPEPSQALIDLMRREPIWQKQNLGPELK